MEYREYRAEPVASDDSGKLFGSAVPFNRETVIGDLKRGGWREEFASGSMNKSIKDGDVVFLAHHDMHMPLARMSAGNLTLRAENDHLAWEAVPVDTSYGRDIRALADAKVLGGVSVGFQPVKDEWFDDEGRPSNRQVGSKRVIREAKLIEISAVTNPAYKDTSIMARDELLAERETRADDEARFEAENALYEEHRASSVSAADRRKLAGKGHALPDGSYPIPDVSHLHAAAVLAASKHGNFKAAKALIRRRAKELGVALASLPGFGKKAGKQMSRDADAADSETRIKKGVAKRIVQLDVELKQAHELLQSASCEEGKEALALVESACEHLGHIKHKTNVSADDMQRSQQEPEASTPDYDTVELALREMERSRREAESEA